MRGALWLKTGGATRAPLLAGGGGREEGGSSKSTDILFKRLVCGSSPVCTNREQMRELSKLAAAPLKIPSLRLQICPLTAEKGLTGFCSLAKFGEYVGGYEGASKLTAESFKTPSLRPQICPLIAEKGLSGILNSLCENRRIY